MGEQCVYITTEETPKTITRTGMELWPEFENMVNDGRIKIINLSISASYASEFALVTKEEAVNILLEGLKGGYNGQTSNHGS